MFLLTNDLIKSILTLERKKEDRKMKSVKTFKYDKFIEAVIKKYGFEGRQTLMFVRLIESTNDSTRVIMMYNKLMQTK